MLTAKNAAGDVVVNCSAILNIYDNNPLEIAPDTNYGMLYKKPGETGLWWHTIDGSIDLTNIDLSEIIANINTQVTIINDKLNRVSATHVNMEECVKFVSEHKTENNIYKINSKLTALETNLSCITKKISTVNFTDASVTAICNRLTKLETNNNATMLSELTNALDAKYVELCKQVDASNLVIQGLAEQLGHTSIRLNSISDELKELSSAAIIESQAVTKIEEAVHKLNESQEETESRLNESLSKVFDCQATVEERLATKLDKAISDLKADDLRTMQLDLIRIEELSKSINIAQSEYSSRFDSLINALRTNCDAKLDNLTIALNSRLDGYETFISNISALEDTLTQNDAYHNAKIQNLTDWLTKLDSSQTARIDSIIESVKALDTLQNTRFIELEACQTAKIDGIVESVKALEKSHTGRLDEIAVSFKTLEAWQSTKLDSVIESVKSLETCQTTKVDNIIESFKALEACQTSKLDEIAESFKALDTLQNTRITELKDWHIAKLDNFTTLQNTRFIELETSQNIKLDSLKESLNAAITGLEDTYNISSQQLTNLVTQIDDRYNTQIEDIQDYITRNGATQADTVKQLELLSTTTRKNTESYHTMEQKIDALNSHVDYFAKTIKDLQEQTFSFANQYTQQTAQITSLQEQCAINYNTTLQQQTVQDANINSIAQTLDTCLAGQTAVSNKVKDLYTQQAGIRDNITSCISSISHLSQANAMLANILSCDYTTFTISPNSIVTNQITMSEASKISFTHSYIVESDDKLCIALQDEECNVVPISTYIPEITYTAGDYIYRGDVICYVDGLVYRAIGGQITKYKAYASTEPNRLFTVINNNAILCSSAAVANNVITIYTTNDDTACNTVNSSNCHNIIHYEANQLIYLAKSDTAYSINKYADGRETSLPLSIPVGCSVVSVKYCNGIVLLVYCDDQINTILISADDLSLLTSASCICLADQSIALEEPLLSIMYDGTALFAYGFIKMLIMYYHSKASEIDLDAKITFGEMLVDYQSNKVVAAEYDSINNCIITFDKSISGDSYLQVFNIFGNNLQKLSSKVVCDAIDPLNMAVNAKGDKWIISYTDKSNFVQFRLFTYLGDGIKLGLCYTSLISKTNLTDIYACGERDFTISSLAADYAELYKFSVDYCGNPYNYIGIALHDCITGEEVSIAVRGSLFRSSVKFEDCMIGRPVFLNNPQVQFPGNLSDNGVFIGTCVGPNYISIGV